eukprot:TRINITY_DN19849_c0_g2_i2.p1 TRINITY_DN19849_c0_g2~~TRINITY_DN19849_c0_g2_i2.p1  ORF type:complete len:135 (-),score=34.83 TRINITY_DN19849_c0_g2_i2:23-427(-)
MFNLVELCLTIVFFFFKQKTAYEMLRSLVGSEMCIRDSTNPPPTSSASTREVGLAPTLNRRVCWLHNTAFRPYEGYRGTHTQHTHTHCTPLYTCLLYTSDAADEEDSVDLGGRRIIKKKKKLNEVECAKEDDKK